MQDRALHYGQVEVGDALPPLRVEVSATTVVLGALASRDWRPMHHDRDFAQQRNGARDIFINTPHNAAYFERYITDWTGPRGRLGRMNFRMRESVFPGDTMVFRGEVAEKHMDAAGCGWLELDIQLSVGEKVTTSCRARVAVPTGPGDNPWQRRGEAWQPAASA